MIVVKTYLKFYFKDYNDLVSPMVHRTSLENIEYILSQADLCVVENCPLGINKSLKELSSKKVSFPGESNDTITFKAKTLLGFFGNEKGYKHQESFESRKKSETVEEEDEYNLKLEEGDSSENQKIEEGSYKVFGERIKRITDTLILFLQNQVDLGSAGKNLQQTVDSLKEKELSQFTPTNIMFRRFLRIMQGVLKDVTDSSKLKQAMEERKGLIFDLLRKYNTDIEEDYLDIDTTQNNSLIIDLALKFCEKMFVSIINAAESYQQAFTEIANNMSQVDIEDTVSLSEKQLEFNTTSPNEFRQIVSQNGSNPLSKVYGLFDK